jgi:predicted aldo/keto reductase-like oxidoreductase
MRRRDFLKTSALATAAIASSPLQVKATAEKPTIRKYQELGTTGLKMSDISLGCGGLPSPSMVLRAIDRGINYLDTAPDYGQSEKYIGEAMKKIQRDKIILASKMCRPARRGHLTPGSREKDYIEAVEGSLSRLNTDYLDICFVHSVGSLSQDFQEEQNRLLDGEMLLAAEALKKAGKIRFLAASSHGPHNMEKLLLAAVKSGHFDVIMPSFNFMMFPNVPAVLEEAKQAIKSNVRKDRSGLDSTDLLKEAKAKGVGVVAMKTLAGARDLTFESDGKPFQPAAFKWTLSYPEISGLVVTIKTVSQLDLYLTASGERMTAADGKILDLYAQRFGKEYCRTGCGHCESKCPRGVEIANSLRYQMYFRDYGMEKKAMESYVSLGKNAQACLHCEQELCAEECPHGLPIRKLLREAHKALLFKA